MLNAFFHKKRDQVKLLGCEYCNIRAIVVKIRHMKYKRNEHQLTLQNMWQCAIEWSGKLEISKTIYEVQSLLETKLILTKRRLLKKSTGSTQEKF